MDTQNEANRPTERERAAMAIGNLIEEARQEGFNEGRALGEKEIIHAARVAEATKRAEELSKRHRSEATRPDGVTHVRKSPPPGYVWAEDDPALKHRYEEGSLGSIHARSLFNERRKFPYDIPVGQGAGNSVPVWTGTSFSAALEWIKDGNKVARHGWNGQGQYVYAQNLPASMLPTYAVIHPVNGDDVPWVASQTDLFADDWYILT